MLPAPLSGDLASCAYLAQLWMSRAAGAPAIALTAERRLRELVRFARRRSPLYRELYRGIPEGGFALRDLPSIAKPELMRRFDESVTDPRVRRDRVERFMGDRGRIGERLLDRYLVWKSSGSTGTPGLFVHDPDAIAIYNALVAWQWTAQLANPAAYFAGAARAALIVATGDHYASIASWENIRRMHPQWQARSFSVVAPLAELVAQLNDYAPTVVAGYPSILLLLADEQRAGRLRLAPQWLWSGGEFIAHAGHERIEQAFDCPLLEEYGASEFLSIAYGCDEGWLHVNADWVLVEPVEADGSPTPDGRLSHTTLITNLANRVQPLIRYELGDRVERKPEPCRCGNPMPAIRVEGRKDDVLRLRSHAGAGVRVVPIAIATVVEEASGEHRFQIAQTAPDALALRFERNGHREDAWRQAHPALRRFLARHGVSNVAVHLDTAVPHLDAGSGKLRMVVDETLFDRGI